MDHVNSERGNEASPFIKDEEIAAPLPASYDSRFEAFILDLLFYVILVISIGNVLHRCGIDRGEEWANLVIAPIPYWIGFVALGVTPGSWLCDIRIVDRHNRLPGLRRAFRRSLIPGTLWVFVVPGLALFDQRIAEFFETNRGFLEFLLFVDLLVLMCFFWSHMRQADKDDLASAWHDAIAGTRVIDVRSERRATLGREIARFRRALGRSHARPSQGVQTKSEHNS